MARIVTPLTNTQIEKAKYSPTTKNELNDGGGLFLELYPTGAKRWRFRYNMPITGKRTKFTIGEYPAVSLAEARNKREEYKSLLAQNIDPQFHIEQQKKRQELEKSNTFLSVANQWKEKKRSEVEEKTLAKYWRSLELHIFPFIGHYPIAEIIPTLALAPLKRVEERNNIDMAQRLSGYINEILNFAVNGGLIPFNPCLKIGKNLKRINKKNNPHISTSETTKLLSDIDASKMEAMTKILLCFQILTMVRPNEACEAEWIEIDFSKKLWTIRAERMKAREPHIVPLSKQAIHLLETLRPITGNFKHIFPKRGNNKQPMSRETANNALKRIGYDGKQTAHGLRGLTRTYLAEKNVIYEHAEACLAHKTGSNVSQAYNHSTYLEQRKEIMQMLADYIEECAKGTDLLK